MKKKFLFLSFLIIGISASGQKQNFGELKINGIQNQKLDDTRMQMEAWYQQNPKGKGSGWKQYQRWLEEMRYRVSPDGIISNHAVKNWQALKQQEVNNSSSPLRLGGNWFNLPMNTVTTGKAGRINCIAFHPSSSNTIFAGSPSGGLWKTTNGGSSWSCISIGISFLGISGIAIHPSDPNIIYILTGDGDSGYLPSIGVLKSTDGGANWFETDLVFDPAVYEVGFELKMAPGNPNLLIAVTNNGIYRTTNGGADWTQELVGPTIFDVEFKPGDANTCYASSGSDIYVSTNAGDTWTPVANGSYTPSKPTLSGRIELAVTQANSGYVYAIFAGASGFRGLCRSTNSGASFTVRSSTPDVISYNVGGGGGNQWWYVLSLTASPVDAELIYAAGINIWKSSDGGANWGGSAVAWFYAGGTKYVHEDIHALESRGTNEVWVGSDGGVFKTTNSGTDWSFASFDLNVLQFYDLDGTPEDPQLFYGGTQDNGAVKYTPGTYEHVGCCDAGEQIINYTNSNNVFMNAANPYIYRSTTGFPASPPATSADVTPTIGCGCQDTLGAFIVEALKMDPINPNVVYAVYRDCFKSTTNGTLGSWVRYATGGTRVHNSMSIAYSNTDIIFISDGFAIRKSINAGLNWNTINLPAGVTGLITQVAVDPSNAHRIWITCGGFTGGVKVFEGNKNAGLDYTFTWTNRSTGLPNVPVLCVALQTTPYYGVYVGTDIGVYLFTSAEGWTPFMSGLPNVKVADLYLDQANGYITAATFGMGLWQSTAYGGCTPFVNHGPIFLATPIYGHEYFEASDSIRSGRFIQGGEGTSVTYNAGHAVRMIPGFEVKAGTVAHAYIEGCTPGSKPIPANSKSDSEKSNQEAIRKNKE